MTAKVEEALKEFEKIVPNIKKQLKQVQEVFSQVNITELKKKVETFIILFKLIFPYLFFAENYNK